MLTKTSSRSRCFLSNFVTTASSTLRIALSKCCSAAWASETVTAYDSKASPVLFNSTLSTDLTNGRPDTKPYTAGRLPLRVIVYVTEALSDKKSSMGAWTTSSPLFMIATVSLPLSAGEDTNPSILQIVQANQVQHFVDSSS